MAERTRSKVQMMEDPNDAARVLLRGLAFGLDAGGQPRCRVDGDLSADQLEQLVEALPDLERRLRARLGRLRPGGRLGTH